VALGLCDLVMSSSHTMSWEYAKKIETKVSNLQIHVSIECNAKDPNNINAAK
jgi:hypothetical protein